MNPEGPPVLDLLEEAVNALRPFVMISEGWQRHDGQSAVVYVSRGGEEPAVVTVDDLHRARDIAALLAFTLWAEGIALDQEYSDFLLGDSPEVP